MVRQLADEIADDAGDCAAAMTNAPLLVTATLAADHTHADLSHRVSFTTHAAHDREVSQALYQITGVKVFFQDVQWSIAGRSLMRKTLRAATRTRCCAFFGGLA
jgi:hypothetical protein